MVNPVLSIYQADGLREIFEEGIYPFCVSGLCIQTSHLSTIITIKNVIIGSNGVVGIMIPGPDQHSAACRIGIELVPGIIHQQLPVVVVR